MSARPLERCGLCGGENLELVLSLGSSPPTCVMRPVGTSQVSEDHYPLELWCCHDCSLVQLGVIVDPQVIFPADYPYSSGNSQALHKNFEGLALDATTFVRGLSPDDLVVDIGANDGTLLSKFEGCRIMGVDPTDQIRPLQERGQAYCRPFSSQLADTILHDSGPAKVITACNVLAHVEDIGDVMRGIELLLADNGVLVAENHDLASVVDGNQWDTIYHEHLRYWDPYTFHHLLKLHGFTGFAAKPIPTHGGSFRMLATKAVPVGRPVAREYDWPAFRKRVQMSRWGLRSAVSAIRHGGRRVGAIGASARATTIIAACGFDVDDIEAVYEVAGSDKIGRYIPGTRVPVVDEQVLREPGTPEYAILFAWYMADTLVPKIRSGVRPYRGELLVPLPKLKHLRPHQRKGVEA